MTIMGCRYSGRGLAVTDTLVGISHGQRLHRRLAIAHEVDQEEAAPVPNVS